MRARRVAAALLLTSTLAAPAALLAQTLERVDSLTREGLTAEAREVVAGWWERESGAASRRDMQRALWLRALVTPDPDEAARDYRRLVVEYPGGPWSDRALLRLGQAAEARGAWREAAASMASIVRDYPGSTAQDEARQWLERNRARVESAPSDPPPSRRAESAPEDAPPRRAEAVREESPPPQRSAPAAPAASPSGPYAVQLGAFSTAERARVLLERARRAGLEARLVELPGSALARVRVGRFTDPAEAARLRGRAITLGFEAVVVGDAARESPVR